MFCSKCGKQLQDDSIFCNGCGAKTVTVKNAAKSSGEVVLMQGLCNRIKSPFYVQNGKAMLTDRRFVYLKHSFVKTLAIGLLVNLTPGEYEFDIPLSEICSIEEGRQGVSQTIVINTKSGERYHFYFTNREQWKAAFRNSVPAADGTI